MKRLWKGYRKLEQILKEFKKIHDNLSQILIWQRFCYFNSKIDSTQNDKKKKNSKS